MVERLHSFLHGFSGCTVIRYLDLSCVGNELEVPHFLLLTDALLGYFSKFPDHLASLKSLNVGCVKGDIWRRRKNEADGGEGYKAFSRFGKEIEFKRPRNLQEVMVDGDDVLCM